MQNWDFRCNIDFKCKAANSAIYKYNTEQTKGRENNCRLPEMRLRKRQQLRQRKMPEMRGVHLSQADLDKRGLFSLNQGYKPISFICHLRVIIDRCECE